MAVNRKAIEHLHEDSRKKVINQRNTEMAQDQKRERRELSKYDKLQPFVDLAQANRRIIERAEKIVELGAHKGGYAEKSPLITLRASIFNHEPRTMGYIERFLDYTGPKDPTFQPGKKRCVFVVFTTVGKSETNDPATLDVEIMDKIQDSTFSIPNHTISPDYGDEIVIDSSKIATYEQIQPANACRRYFYNRFVQKSIEGLEETVSLFEQAVSNPMLNPHLMGHAHEFAAAIDERGYE